MGDNDDFGDPNDEAEGQRQVQEAVNAFVKNRIARVEKVYDYSITSLWIANAGAAIAVLTFIGSTWNGGAFYRPAIGPLGFFLTGLISMGIGSLLLLISEGQVIHRMERANSLLDFRVGDSRSPSERAGLSLRDSRTVSALISGVLFVIGVILGFIRLIYT